MMMRFNEEKVFADSVDDQLVVLMIENGTYYTFNRTAAAVLQDLNRGYKREEVAAALKGSFGDLFAEKKLDAFLEMVLEKGVMEETEGFSGAPCGESECAALSSADGVFELIMDGYDDVASYFMIDPIHEVDPQMGWPHTKEEE